MFKQLSQYDKKNFKKFIYLHAVPLILFLVYSAVLSYCSYKGGFTVTESNSYFGVRFLMLFLFLPILFVFFVYYIIILFAIEKKYILPSIALGLVSSFIFLYTIGLGMVHFPAKGYYDYVKANVDLDEIHDWLLSYEFSKYDDAEYGRVFEDNWPESIKALNPSRGVLLLESEGKKYIRISHGVDWELSIGLCVMEEPMDIPEYGDDFNDKRIKLSDNAFVWAGD